MQAIHASEDIAATRAKIVRVNDKLRALCGPALAELVKAASTRRARFKRILCGLAFS
jgi:hypothetical protein